MKKITCMILAAFAAAMLAACSDKGSSEEPAQPDISAVTVAQADLAAAVWGADSDQELSPDADCIASSSFKVEPDKGFDILKTSVPLKSGLREEKAQIVSNINIYFSDAASDGRGAKCAAEGSLAYSVVASAEAPIDIEPALTIKSRHSIVGQAKTSPTPYPKCQIAAHFEKTGTVLCGQAPVEPTEPAEETPPGDETTNPETPGDNTGDDGNDDDDNDTPIIWVPGGFRPIGATRQIGSTINFSVAKAAAVNEDGIPCGTEEVHSVKLIVDDVNCSVSTGSLPFQGSAPNYGGPLPWQNPNQNSQQ